MNIKQAVILSAGLGTRLRPYTDKMPKPMLPILGKPMLEWHIEQYKKHGVSEFFMNLHYLPEVIRDHFGDGTKWGVKINYNFEPVILGTAGGVKQFESRLDELFYLVYGDTFSLMDYTKMREAYENKPKEMLGMQRMQKLEDYADADVAELDADGKYVAIHPKPHAQEYPNAYRMRGTFILNRRILSFVPPDKPYEIGKQLLPDIVARGEKFYSYECDDFSKGIDTEDKWRDTEKYLNEHGIGRVTPSSEARRNF